MTRSKRRWVWNQSPVNMRKNSFRSQNDMLLASPIFLGSRWSRSEIVSLCTAHILTQISISLSWHIQDICGLCVCVSRVFFWYSESGDDEMTLQRISVSPFSWRRMHSRSNRSQFRTISISITGSIIWSRLWSEVLSTRIFSRRIHG